MLWSAVVRSRLKHRKMELKAEKHFHNHVPSKHVGFPFKYENIFVKKICVLYWQRAMRQTPQSLFARQNFYAHTTSLPRQPAAFFR